MIGTIKLYSKYKMCSNVQTKHDPSGESDSSSLFFLEGRPGDGWMGSLLDHFKANSWDIWTWTQHCCSLLCFGQFQWRRTEPWWLKTGKNESCFCLTFFKYIFFSAWDAKHTKYSIRLCVIFLTVQTEQSAVVEIFDEAFKVSTKRTPHLQHKHALMPNPAAPDWVHSWSRQ